MPQIKFKIGQRLFAGFLQLIVFIVTLSALSIVSLSAIHGTVTGLFSASIPSIDALDQSDRDLQQLLVDERSMLTATPGSDEFKSLVKDYEENLQQSIDRLNKYASLAPTSEQKTLVDGYRQARAKWEPLSRQVLTLAASANPADRLEARTLSLGPVATSFETMREFLNKSEDLVLAQSAANSKIAAETYSRTFIILLVLAALATLIAVIMTILLARGITRPIQAAVQLATSIAGGDLTVQIEDRHRERFDESGELSRSLTNMETKLSSIVQDVKQASDRLSSSGQAMSSAADQLAEGASEQAASAEEVSSSMEQMDSNIKQNAENAMQTESIARQAAAEAEESGHAVQESVTAMREIADRISVIEEIARQTNLLALNAAIEAARAGDQGKGFAVVASEVRRLAERSQTSAGQIMELAQSSVSVAERAGEMLDRLVPSIRKTSDLVQEINASSGEQSSGVDQINKAISQLDKIIQQNASSAEEMSSTAQELAEQAMNLQRTMSFFRFDDSAPTARALPRAPEQTGIALREDF